MKNTDLYVDREISWLQFNERVMQEAEDVTNPLVERLSFLGIFSNNLDDFFRVRVASLNRMMQEDNFRAEYQIDPAKTLRKVVQMIEQLQHKFDVAYEAIVKELEQKNIFILNETQLNKEQYTFVEQYFRSHVRLHLFPIMLDKLKDHSSLREHSIYLAVELGKSNKKTNEKYAIVEIPEKISRFVIVPSKAGKECVMWLDDVIRLGLKDIFSPLGYTVFSAYTFKFTRDSEINTDVRPTENVLEIVSDLVKQRMWALPLRFVYDRAMPARLLKMLMEKLQVHKEDVFQKGGRYHNKKDLMQFPRSLAGGSLVYEEFTPVDAKEIPLDQNVLDVIKQGDIMLHYPYQSFQNVIDLLRESSIDERVKSIKITVYRVAKDSAIMNALINAARNGKQVVVYMELKARFDEENNIHWAERLMSEGVQVLDILPGYKVHCKLILITASENRKTVRYAAIGTGNPNEDTARIYTDKHLLTANPSVTKEVSAVFDFLENKRFQNQFNQLLVSPFNMRKRLVEMIDAEIENAKSGRKAWMILKMNSLTDRKLINLLYAASQSGVQVKLIVRGVCALRPQVPGLSENIEGISIVDRFLEHARVYAFCNGGKTKLYVGSADWMLRNLDYRVEVLAPVLDKTLQDEALHILQIQLEDNMHARVVNAQKPNEYKRSSGKKIRSQWEIWKHLQKRNKK